MDPFLQAAESQYYMNQDITVSEMKFKLIYEEEMPDPLQTDTIVLNEETKNKTQRVLRQEPET